VLKISVSADTIVTTLDDLLFEDHWHYLYVAFLNHLWDNECPLLELFPSPEETSKNRKKDISIGDIAKILTFYLCINTGSYLTAVDWFKTTACDLIIGIDGAHFNESRIYRELTVIEQQKEKIEQWLYDTLKERDKECMRLVFYDFPILIYRAQNRVEEGFKEVKSFLKFQPTFAYTKEHIRAHYTICILSYLLDVSITNKLRENMIEGVSSVNKMYRILEGCEIGKLGVKGDKSRTLKLTAMASAQKNILEMFNFKYLGMNKHLKSIGFKMV